ncbi:OX-2 membrane glycoprotein-like [Chanos chanos]|uniref:OX-2 membrane glycoprotein-like n=1 Tax=Chanos chanos TaxID=29144 RepID=A0A6J2VS84_CHACN|nr:OX-2 membrane glycoprotein-like [Chanos chanos]
MQVTWLKQLRGSVEILATYNSRYKEKIMDSHVGKIMFQQATFGSTTLKVNNVTFADEACYVCVFDIYPTGSERDQVCLTVQGVSEITTKLQTITSPGLPLETGVVITCTATGKPTPEIRWNSEENLSEYVGYQNNTTMLNDGRTMTTSSNLTVWMSKFGGKYVDCVAQSGDVMEQRRIIVVNENWQVIFSFDLSMLLCATASFC